MWVIIYGLSYMGCHIWVTDNHIWLITYGWLYMDTHIWLIIYGWSYMITLLSVYEYKCESYMVYHIWSCSYMIDHIWTWSYMVDHIWTWCSYMVTHIWSTIYGYRIWLSFIIIYGPHMIICGRIWFTVYDWDVRIWWPYMNISVYEFIYEHQNTWDESDHDNIQIRSDCMILLKIIFIINFHLLPTNPRVYFPSPSPLPSTLPLSLHTLPKFNTLRMYHHLWLLLL